MNINPDLRRFVVGRASRGPMPSPRPVLEWIGRPYGKTDCWKFVRDAYQVVGGVELPESYYEATAMFTQVPDPRVAHAEQFVPQPWDIPLLRTIDRIPVLVLHPALTIDSERFIQTWSDAGPAVFRFDDERVAFRIAGFIRLCKS